MKFYKLENNKFKGFYDEEINKEDLFVVTYKEEEKEIEEVTTDEEGNEITETKTEIIQVPVYTLKENYFELSEEKWKELLNGQSQGKEIKILKNGELGLFEKPKPPQDFYKPVWNEIEEEWEEGANKIDLLKEKSEKVLKLRKIKIEINTLKEIAEIDEELADEEMIELYQNEYDLLKKEILALSKVIKSL